MYLKDPLGPVVQGKDLAGGQPRARHGLNRCRGPADIDCLVVAKLGVCRGNLLDKGRVRGGPRA